MKGPIDNGQLEGVAAWVRQLMPAHTVYCEPWFEGGEVFFTKRPSRQEVVNCPDERLANFYMTVRTDWQRLQFLIESTLYSDTLAALARKVERGGSCYDAIYRAWALWLRYDMKKLHRSSWMVDTAAWMAGERTDDPQAAKVSAWMAERLRHVRILDRDALEVIRTCDSEATFFYLHPPGRKEAESLLEVIPRLKGRVALYIQDRKLAGMIAAGCGLFKECDDDGNTVYVNFVRQKTLFETD